MDAFFFITICMQVGYNTILLNRTEWLNASTVVAKRIGRDIHFVFAKFAASVVVVLILVLSND